MTDLLKWAETLSPTAEEFEELALNIWKTLPEDFRSLCPDLIFQIEEFPEEYILEELECETPYDLTGFFYGVGSNAPAMMVSEEPDLNTLWLFRRPILDCWAEGELTVKEIIAHIIITEIGHYFGMTDHDLALIEVAASGRQTEIVH